MEDVGGFVIISEIGEQIGAFHPCDFSLQLDSRLGNCIF